MERLVIFCLIIFLNFGCSSKQDNNKYKEENSISTTKGKLVCNKTKNRYRKVKLGEKVIYSFIFYNSGTEPVKIVDYDVSCNCTEIRFDKKEVNPKDSLKVTMIIETKDKHSGPQSSIAVLKTNGERIFYDISVKYDIE